MTLSMSPLVTVLIGTSLLGGIAGVVGCFAVLRRRALVGDLVAHAALPGICLAFLIAGQRQFSLLLAGALLTGLLGVSLVTFISRWTRTKEDAAIGIVLSTFFGLGIAMMPIIQRSAGGSKAGLETYLYGQAASMVRQDLWMISGVSAVALFLVCLLYKEFKLLSFDQGFARAQGWPTVWLDLAMMGLMALIVVVGLPAVGVVLMAAMLITPAAAARMWTNRLGLMLLLAASFGAATGVLGTVLSDDRWREAMPFDPLKFGANNKALPTGPLIVLSGTAIFLFSLAFAPRRGLIARVFGQFRLRSRVAREHLLRTLYELSEPGLPAATDFEIEKVAQSHAWTPLERWAVLAWARRQGLTESNRYEVRLTARGLQEAAELTRRHRLWELFLIHGANIAPDHVDRDADDIEHILPPDVLARIESELQDRQASIASPTVVPDSPHIISSPSAAGERDE
jgi:manganese/zinc/iron transport system permease protein